VNRTPTTKQKTWRKWRERASWIYTLQNFNAPTFPTLLGSPMYINTCLQIHWKYIPVPIHVLSLRFFCIRLRHSKDNLTMQNEAEIDCYRSQAWWLNQNQKFTFREWRKRFPTAFLHNLNIIWKNEIAFRISSPEKGYASISILQKGKRGMI